MLAYLGQIDKSYSAAQSRRIGQLGHLDLSNIQLAPKKPAESAKKPMPEELARPAPEVPIEVALPVNLAAALACQKRIEDTLNIHLPLSTLIARASEVANDDLPRQTAAPTADELFYNVLGSSTARSPKVSRGHYVPRLASFRQSGPPPKPMSSKSQADIYDILTGTQKSVVKQRTTSDAAAATKPLMDVFTLSVSKAEKDRAQTFLQRIKVVLEREPGRLVI